MFFITADFKPLIKLLLQKHLRKFRSMNLALIWGSVHKLYDSIDTKDHLLDEKVW